MINTYASVEDEEWTTDYRPCGIERDCMNASIIDRNNLIEDPPKFIYLSVSVYLPVSVQWFQTIDTAETSRGYPARASFPPQKQFIHSFGA